MDRPFVHLNVAATADGKIDTFERRGAAISSARDKERVDRLRAAFDGVMVGGHTLHDEDPSLTVKSEGLRRERQQRGLPTNPSKVAVTSRLQLEPDCKFLTAGPARIILFTTPRTPASQLSMLRGVGAEVHILGEGRVDLVRAMRVLVESGIARLMLEGGATLNSEMLRLGLVDELTVFVAPFIFGGETAPTLSGGSGLPSGSPMGLDLVRLEQWEDGGVLLHYRVQNHPATGQGR
jgi:2,5-diamino-6-hydroxy-4-(5-phosphoribosylamino)pyrimidine 1'-reductase